MDEIITLHGKHQFKVFTTKTADHTFKAEWEDLKDGESGDAGKDEPDEALALLAAKFFAHARCNQKYPEPEVVPPRADVPSQA